MLTFIFAASEEDAKKYCSDEPTIRFLLEKLNGALKSKDKRCDGYSNIELLEGTVFDFDFLKLMNEDSLQNEVIFLLLIHQR